MTAAAEITEPFVLPEPVELIEPAGRLGPRRHGLYLRADTWERSSHRVWSERSRGLSWCMPADWTGKGPCPWAPARADPLDFSPIDVVFWWLRPSVHRPIDYLTEIGVLGRVVVKIPNLPRDYVLGRTRLVIVHPQCQWEDDAWVYPEDRFRPGSLVECVPDTLEILAINVSGVPTVTPAWKKQAAKAAAQGGKVRVCYQEDTQEFMDHETFFETEAPDDD